MAMDSALLSGHHNSFIPDRDDEGASHRNHFVIHQKKPVDPHQDRDPPRAQIIVKIGGFLLICA